MATTDEAIKEAVEAAQATMSPTATGVMEQEPPQTFFATPEELLETAKAALDADLRTIVDEVKSTPQMRAKMTRTAFSARGWPNDEHPGTVKDFLIQFNIPAIDSTIKLRAHANQVSETKSGE